MDVEVVRGADPHQLPGLEALITVVRHHDGHEPLGEHKWLDLVHGTRYAGVVAGPPEAPAGYAHLSRHPDGWGMEMIVHPEHREAGLEEQLLERALRVVAEGGGGHAHLFVFKPTQACDEFTTKLGFRPGRDLLYVCVPLPVAERPDLPPGVTIRGFERGRDEDAWLEVNNSAFAGHPEQGAWDRAMLERRMREPWFRPEDLLLAADDAGGAGGVPSERIAGFNWTKLHRETAIGEIYVVGVDPRRQGTKLGKALVLAALEHMADEGMRGCCLYVDRANEKALRMYERIGFTVDHTDRVYVIDVPPG